MTFAPNSPAARDVAYLLHPYTSARRHEAEGPMIIERGHGIYVYDDEGREYIEGLAGLWSVAVGFNEPRLKEAAAAQMESLPYYHSFAHKSHMPAIELAERLVEMAPGRMSKVFYTNSGSEANDTVIKLIRYYNNALGRPEKKKIISREGAYHGVAVGSASLTGLLQNHRDFDLPIPGILHAACPHHWRFAAEGESEEDFASRLAGELEALIEREGPETVAAFIGEPVMGAGGVIVPPRTYWQKVQEVCRRHDVLVVADEVITGFGRTGRSFGCETFGIEPDVVVLSKQLTSSYAPLSAVLISEDMYQAVAGNSARIGTFGHGFTTSGHPLAIAVALANLDVFEDDRLMDHAARVGPHFQDGLRRLADHPLVGEVRGVGLIAAVQLVADKAAKRGFEPPGRAGLAFFAHAHAHGLIVRNILDSIALCPPLIITEEQIAELLRRFARTLEDCHQAELGSSEADASTGA